MNIFALCVLGSPRQGDNAMQRRTHHLVERRFLNKGDVRAPAACGAVPRIVSKGWVAIGEPWRSDGLREQYDCKTCWRLWHIGQIVSNET